MPSKSKTNKTKWSRPMTLLELHKRSPAPDEYWDEQWQEWRKLRRPRRTLLDRRLEEAEWAMDLAMALQAIVEEQGGPPAWSFEWSLRVWRYVVKVEKYCCQTGRKRSIPYDLDIFRMAEEYKAKYCKPSTGPRPPGADSDSDDDLDLLGNPITDGRRYSEYISWSQLASEFY